MSTPIYPPCAFNTYMHSGYKYRGINRPSGHTTTTTTYDFFVVTTGVKIQVYNATFAPFGSCTGATLSVPGICAVDIQTNVSDNGNRTRLCLDIPVPTGVTSCSSITLKMKPTGAILPNTATLAWYSSNTDDFSSGGSGCGGIPRPFNTNNGPLDSISTASMVSGTQFTLTASSTTSYVAQAGGHFSCVLALTNDVSNSDPGALWRGGASFSKSVGDFTMTVTYTI